MKKKYLFLNLGANLIAFMVNFIIAFFITPYIIKHVGKETYGFIGLANNLTNFALVFSVALNSLAGRFVTINICQNRIEEAKRYFNSILYSNLIFSGLLIIPLVFFICKMESFLNLPNNNVLDIKLTFVFVFLAFMLNLIFSVFSVATFVRNKIYLNSIRLIQSNIIKVLLIIVSFAIFTPKISYVTNALFISTLFIVIVNINYTKKLLPEIKISRKYFMLKYTIKLLKSGLWNSLTALSNLLLEGLDLLITNLWLGPIAMGIIAIVKTIPGILNQFLTSIISAFLPQITIDYANSKMEEIVEYINFTTKVVGMLMVLPLNFVIVFGEDFFMLWLPNEDYKLLWILSIMSLSGLIFAGSVNIFYNLFTVTDKLKAPALVTLTTGVLNTGIVLVLLKLTNLGIYAVVGVSAILGILRNIFFNIPYAARCIDVKKRIFYKMVGRSLLMLTISIVISSIVRLFLNLTSWLNLVSINITLCSVVLIVNYLLFFSCEEKKRIVILIKQKLKR